MSDIGFKQFYQLFKTIVHIKAITKEEFCKATDIPTDWCIFESIKDPIFYTFTENGVQHYVVYTRHFAHPDEIWEFKYMEEYQEMWMRMYKSDTGWTIWRTFYQD